MKIKILAFGITKDILGASEKELDVQDDLNVGQLKEKLERTSLRL
jgi:molybdopterin synthase sulfur carrier subunit